MLCESKQRIGFLGASYFIGVIIASSIVPVGYLSDVFGRKWVFISSIITMLIGCYGLLISFTLD